MPFVKVVRSMETRGSGMRPVTVQFEKHSVCHALMKKKTYFCDLQDRNAVLQRANLLKGTTILISEDFPQKVVKKRELLIKYAKKVSLVLFRNTCSPYFYFPINCCT